MMEVLELAQRFAPEGVTVPPQPFGNGHINDTYVFTTTQQGKPARVVLQRISRAAFPHPELVMENMLRVTQYLQEQIRANGGDPNRETLSLYPTQDGGWYTQDDEGGMWRACRFVENSSCSDQADSPERFRAAGQAFGSFQRMLSGFDAKLLHETIVNFHHTPKRYEAFHKAVEADVCGRAAGVKPEIEVALSQEAFAGQLIAQLEKGELPLRVTHNDTKLNNVLFDAQTGRGLCVIDLDTVMPGLSCYDFGDAIRFGANTAAEDEKDVSRVCLSLPMFRAYAEGYLGEAGGALTEAELRSLPVGSKMMTLECGVRFLTDYLSGDTYFKIAYPEHNLVRARSQFALVRSMDEHWAEMNEIILSNR